MALIIHLTLLLCAHARSAVVTAPRAPARHVQQGSAATSSPCAVIVVQPSPASPVQQLRLATPTSSTANMTAEADIAVVSTLAEARRIVHASRPVPGCTVEVRLATGVHTGPLMLDTTDAMTRWVGERGAVVSRPSPGRTNLTATTTNRHT